MNLFDQFLATQGRMAQNEGQELINRANLQKITEAERAQKMQADTLAFYQKQASPTTTLANLSEMKETPDAGMESQGLRQMTPEVGAAPKTKTPAQSLLDSASETARMAKELQSINPAEADRLRKERDNLLTKAAPLLKEERLAQLAEAEQVQQWVGSVKDPQSFQVVMSQVAQKHPEWLKMKDPQGNQLFPRNLDGSFAYGPAQQAVVEAMGNQSIKKIDALKLADKVEDNKRADLDLERKIKADADKVRTDNQKLALAREGKSVEAKPAKAPTGYRYTKDGDLEPIPGGPADDKVKGKYNQDTQSLTTIEDNLTRLEAQAKKVLDHPGLDGITGIRGKIPNIPGTDAANAMAELTTLKTQVGFGALQAMRDASKTGGALGQVSDFENKALQNSLVALDNSQSADEFRKNLKDVMKYAVRAKDNHRKAYNTKYADKKEGESAFVDGQVYQDASGNKAKYVNGQWVPQ